MVRAPLWLIAVLLIAAIGVGVYAYYTTPLPLGLSSVVRTPGGDAAAALTPTAAPAPTGRTPPGQALVLGATSVTVRSVVRNQALPMGTFTVVDVTLQNFGSQPLTPQPSAFQLVDESGRVYAVDTEATRSANTTSHRRVVFDASVPPTGTLNTLLAFETPADATSLTLRVSLGYGELELPAATAAATR